MISIEKEKAGDRPTVEFLLDLAFGPGRFAKSSYRLREGVAPLAELCFVGRFDGETKGSIRYWPVRVGTSGSALLLGPLAVDPSIRGKGLGIALIDHSLQQATQLGHNVVFLVGDEPYYAKSGFRKTEPDRFTFPGPVDPNRLLVRELIKKTDASFSGLIHRDRSNALSAPSQQSHPGDDQEK